MKIIEDKFNCDKRMTCERCNSIFEYDEDDIQGLPFGDSYVCCPCCGEQNYLEDGDQKITVDNLKFPDNFYHFGASADSVCISDKQILNWIKKGIEDLRSKNTNRWIMSGSGDSMVWVVQWPEDKEYTVYVARGYYAVDIPFENIDYESVE